MPEDSPYFPLMPLQGLHTLPCWDIPDPNRLVKACASQGLSCCIEGYCPNGALVSLEGLQAFPRLSIPKGDGAIATTTG
jgi:hypothetical protein